MGGKKDEVIFLLLRQEYTYKVNYLSCYKSRPRLGDAGPSTRGLFSFVDQLLYLKTVAAKLYIIPFQKKLYIIFFAVGKTLYSKFGFLSQRPEISSSLLKKTLFLIFSLCSNFL